VAAGEEEIRKFKLLGTGGAVVALLALIAALYLQMQNAGLSSTIARLESERAQLAEKNDELRAQLEEARASAKGCAGASQLTALLPLIQSGMLGNITSAFVGMPSGGMGLPTGLPGGLPLSGMGGAGNFSGVPGLTPEMMRAILEAIRNASANQSTQYR